MLLQQASQKAPHLDALLSHLAARHFLAACQVSGDDVPALSLSLGLGHSSTLCLSLSCTLLRSRLQKRSHRAQACRCQCVELLSQARLHCGP